LRKIEEKYRDIIISEIKDKYCTSYVLIEEKGKVICLFFTHGYGLWKVQIIFSKPLPVKAVVTKLNSKYGISLERQNVCRRFHLSGVVGAMTGLEQVGIDLIVPVQLYLGKTNTADITFSSPYHSRVDFGKGKIVVQPKLLASLSDVEKEKISNFNNSKKFPEEKRKSCIGLCSQGRQFLSNYIETGILDQMGKGYLERFFSDMDTDELMQNIYSYNMILHNKIKKDLNMYIISRYNALRKAFEEKENKVTNEALDF
jgi:hypothetical protein